MFRMREVLTSSVCEISHSIVLKAKSLSKAKREASRKQFFLDSALELYEDDILVSVKKNWWEDMNKSERIANFFLKMARFFATRAQEE